MNDAYIDTLSLDYFTSIFNEYLASKNTVGVDGVSVECFANNLVKETEIIQRKILNKSYDFSLYKEKLILKNRHSCPRVIAIPTIRDKVVIKSLHIYLNETLNVDISMFSAHTYIKSIKSAMRDEKQLNGFIRIDIKNFFPSIDHKILMGKLKNNLNSDSALKLIEKCICQTIVARHDKNRGKYQNKQGIPQGLAISGLLADFYLQSIDKYFQQNTQLKYYRFVDDILILCRKEDIDAIRCDLIQQINNLGLSLHDEGNNPEKSSSGCISKGIDYLGYIFKGKKITVRQRSIDKLYVRLGRTFSKYTTQGKEDFNQLYYKINMIITGCFYDEKPIGWLCYFKHINDLTLLYRLDRYINKLCSRYKGRKGPLNRSQFKSFVRGYWEVKRGIKSNYIPKFNHQKNTKPTVITRDCLQKIKKLEIDFDLDQFIEDLCEVNPYD